MTASLDHAHEELPPALHAELMDAAMRGSSAFARRLLTGERHYIFSRECLICGELLRDDQITNKEHVISQWALDEFGIRRAKGVMYNEWKQDGTHEKKIFDLNSLQVRVHKSCNDYWSVHIENSAAAAVHRLRRGDKLTSGDVHALMDWVDRVRAMMGIFVGTRGVNISNSFPIFYPIHKVGLSDRMLLIYKAGHDETDVSAYPVSVYGPLLPSYHRTPTAFYIRLQELAMIIVTDVNLGELASIKMDNEGRVFASPGEVFFQPINMKARTYELIRASLGPGGIYKQDASYGVGAIQSLHPHLSNIAFSPEHVFTMPYGCFFNDQAVDESGTCDVLYWIKVTQLELKRRKAFQGPDLALDNLIEDICYRESVRRSEMIDSYARNISRWRQHVRS